MSGGARPLPQAEPQPFVTSLPYGDGGGCSTDTSDADVVLVSFRSRREVSCGVLEVDRPRASFVERGECEIRVDKAVDLTDYARARLIQDVDWTF
jgi:hypothetical protein